MSLRASIAALLALAAAPAMAAVYHFEYEALSPSHMQAVSGDFGQALAVGDTATFVLRTQPGFEFQSAGGLSMWGALAFLECGTRQADYSFSFLNNGAMLLGGNVTQATSCVHIGPNVNVMLNGAFDEYRWTATFNGSTASGDTTTSAYTFLSTNATLARANDVPEPGTLALAALALIGLGVARRKA